ncbi:hypothetical protein [Pelagicoccus mobilis]|uniref:Alpha-L-rhamnosidase six-hairpin glycosidase domain-containing protein n=1 Tax=Pelagicoccus mobilis TaxID=415221 RepID=A0A934RZ98_9BACT|nr:hypothetical protein [Pelagicoccus mobilis]MBK1876228.1 hypothetical protein [Pelagicoccus mobilis]
MTDREPPSFFRAKPVWVRGLHERMNSTVGFHVSLEYLGDPLVLRLAAANTYRIWLNGKWFAYGPARAAHGYLRVDEWDLASALVDGANSLAIEVVAYRVNSFSVLNAQGCLMAEVTRGEEAVAWTCARTGRFCPGVLEHRVRRVKRFSYQRPFGEAYRLTPQSDTWRVEGWGQRDWPPYLDNLEVVPKLLPRRMPYPEFPLRSLTEVGQGRFTIDETIKESKSLARSNVGLNLLGFASDELEVRQGVDWDQCRFGPVESGADVLGVLLEQGTYVDFDLPANLTGFLRVVVSCEVPVRLLAGWAEFKESEHLDVYQQETDNIISWELEPGRYELEGFEANTFRHLRLVARKGAVRIHSVEQRGYEAPARLSSYSEDPELAAIQRAAVSTYCQNTVDTFMDCPSRERAGWLGDSFFIGRAAQALGESLGAETAFLENYLLAPDPFFSLPDGMFPMCYPSEHYYPEFIPQWSLWLVMQVDDYQKRGGDAELVARYESRLRRLFAWFANYENGMGLLEKLPGWNFVEWSKANELVQDVNFPTQFLYAAALRAFAGLFGDTAFAARADAVAKESLAFSRSEGERWFRDRALRKERGLEVTADSTEICQYSPFFFDLIKPEDEPELWRRLLSEFGPGIEHPEVHPANLLFGWIMRFDLLKRYGQREQLLKEVKAMFGPMAQKTGTLWEHDQAKASLCHGFGAYVLALISE